MKLRTLGLVSVVASALCAQTLSLHNGWNLRGAINGIDAKNIKADCIDLVWKFDTINNKWLGFSNKASLDTLLTQENYTKINHIDHGEGFWVKANGACMVNVQETITLQKLGTYDTNKEAGSEIVAYDSITKRLYITNGADKTLDIVDVANPSSPTLIKSVTISTYGADLQSVAVKNGKVAVAVGSASKSTEVGKVVIFDTNGENATSIAVGFLPDMVTFNEDGTKILVANEGEPSGDYTNDPKGSIGIIDIATSSYVDIDFSNATLSNANDGTPVRLGGTPSNDKAKDIEPEYITVKGNFAYIALQENNALAKVNLTTNQLEFVKSLGAKSYENGSGNTIDIEEEGDIDMKNYPGLFALFMPDSIASYSVDGKTYLVTANEGDGREYPEEDGVFNGKTIKKGKTLTDDEKISKLALADSIKSAYADDNDIKVMKDMGKNSAGQYEKLYSFGGRSFSIWDENGNLVWDSGDQFEKKIAELEPNIFNQETKASNGTFTSTTKDGRSGNKGVEPEAIAIGEIGDKVYAFIGLERQNGIMIYDITKPTAPTYVNYTSLGTEDISPEGLKFIPASKSPNGKNLLVSASEISGTTTIFEIK